MLPTISSIFIMTASDHFLKTSNVGTELPILLNVLWKHAPEKKGKKYNNVRLSLIVVSLFMVRLLENAHTDYIDFFAMSEVSKNVLII